MGDPAVVSTILPATAKAARSVGSLVYFTGNKCSHGHTANRYTSTYQCVECANGLKAKERNQNWYRENGDKRNAKKRASRKADPLKHAEYQADYARRNPIKMMLISARGRAKQRGLVFDLIEADITIPEVCPVLGIKLCTGDYPNASPSLDRIDNTKGYVRGNVAVISTRANLIKRDASLDELKKLVAYMVKHQQS